MTERQNLKRSTVQLPPLDSVRQREVKPFRLQLLKWVGNKQRFADEIISYFPSTIGKYFEPFLGSGAVLGTLAPEVAIGSDSFRLLIEIFQTLRISPKTLNGWYRERWELLAQGDKREVYEWIKARYNREPNAADLLFICRACYGGVVRFRKGDGFISTPVGSHTPISPERFERAVDEWHERIRGTEFRHMEFEEAMQMAKPGDLVYCDPPYSHSQSILYGAQDFSLSRLFLAVEECKARGVYVVMSIAGSKRSGSLLCDVPIPEGLFERELGVNVGRSMLKRFQMNSRTLENEMVRDRLLLTY